MKVAVENKALVAKFASEESQHFLQGKLVAIQPSDYVEHIKIAQRRRCFSGENRRGIAIIQRACPSRRADLRDNRNVLSHEVSSGVHTRYSRGDLVDPDAVDMQ